MTSSFNLTNIPLNLKCNNDVSHAFHKDCIDKWLMNKPSCPLCKTSILSPLFSNQ